MGLYFSRCRQPLFTSGGRWGSRACSPEGTGPLTGGRGTFISLPPSAGSTDRVLCLKVSCQDMLNVGFLLPSLAFSCTGDTGGSYAYENKGNLYTEMWVDGSAAYQCGPLHLLPRNEE